MSELAEPRLQPASSWSAIWILPIVALCIGAWLAWQSYSQSGIEVKVFFESGEGIAAGKTEVIYKGMPIGKVIGLKLDDEGERRGVLATLELNQDFSENLRADTRFWLVKPNLSLAGITGLETLVSGNYIAVSPGQGEPTRDFVALASAPPLPDSQPGLHLTLKADRLGSLDRDSPVFYRQVQVGRVKSYRLAEDQTTIEINIYIEPEYASLVRKHTRFWNASGLSIDASLSGIKVRSESLASLLAGGIAFATPEHRQDSPPLDPSVSFRLYEDFASAQAGLKVLLKLVDFDGLSSGRTPVMYQGIEVGQLKKLTVDPSLSYAQAELIIDPLAEDYIVEGTDFWVVRPSISLAGITGLEALVKGNYIALRPGEPGQAAKREFVAQPKAPPLDLKAPGLHLVLFANARGSLEVGSPVLYKQVRVGSVQSYQFSRDQSQVVFGVHIEPEYANLVNASSKFWNASGISLKAGLAGVELKSESLQTLMSGGIAFETQNPSAKAISRVERFQLHADRDEAFKRGQSIRLVVEQADGLKPGTAIRYKGLEMGQVEAVELSADLSKVILHVRITEAAARIAAKGSRFWQVKPKVGLNGVEHLETLVMGPYIEVQPAPSGAPLQTEFSLQAQAPKAQNKGLELTLSAARRGSLVVGSPVTYREVQVGRVTDVGLGPTADRVLIGVVIEPRYSNLVHTGSRFWNISGFGLDVSLFGGAKLRTESVETLLQGGVAFATPDEPLMGNPALPKQTFALFDEPRPEWLSWAPRLKLAPKVDNEFFD